MKLSALHQSYLSRPSNSFRSSGPLDSSSDSGYKSPAAVFWLILHGLCCLISLVPGFHFSCSVFFFFFSTSSSNLYTPPFRSAAELAKTLDVHSVLPALVANNIRLPFPNKTATNSRVVVGRHGIRVRPWLHPDPVEAMKAHRILERVQKEQRLQFGVKDPKTIIVVTPTYVRTFQALHLAGVMQSLMVVPYNLIWIMVEAGGVSNETASFIEKSGLKTIHVGFSQPMPNSWDERHKLESIMRLHALRIVREKKLDGIVMFADDSNMHSMELFDEIQNVKWFGAVSVGILATSANIGGSSDRKGEEENPRMPIQDPACNESNMLAGWHTFNTLPFARKSAVNIDDRLAVLPRKLEWSGFVLNSRLLWKDRKDKPEWIKDIDMLDGDVGSPLGLITDPSVVEPLGSCGLQVLLWWLRVEAHADSKFPHRPYVSNNIDNSKLSTLYFTSCSEISSYDASSSSSSRIIWIIDPPLDITIPSKRTPWPDAPPEHPAKEKPEMGIQEPIVKHTTKTRTSRTKHRSKSKHETRTDKHVAMSSRRATRDCMCHARPNTLGIRGHPTEAIRPRPSRESEAIRPRPSDRGHPNELCEGIQGQLSELCEGIRGKPSEGRSPGVHGDLQGRPEGMATYKVARRSPGVHGDLQGRPECMATYGQHCEFHPI
ncbi:putative beta-1,4-xylosyltransferase IRX14H [Hibiscus syriacus]|uniref:Glycosyltransferases n=1 Tax=Hibiscus syriacus TaxID=106335 RepID=A0A6A2YDG5_HIBSY|nr:putative beta-1,4-xylosyltransferase IRX14H [Hibiscus syriacus]